MKLSYRRDMCGYIGIRGGVLISMYSSVWVGKIVRMQNCTSLG